MNIKKIVVRSFVANILLLGSFVSTPIAAAEEATKAKQDGKESFQTSDRTNIDFSDTMIEGKMQAPSGFFLQGRQAQSLSQMVKLRSNFRNELRNSKSAVKSQVK
jgi:hypothetical protein